MPSKRSFRSKRQRWSQSSHVRTRLAESPRTPASLRISALQWTEPPGRARSTGSIAPSKADRCRADLAAHRRSRVTSPEDLEHGCKGVPLRLRAVRAGTGRGRGPLAPRLRLSGAYGAVWWDCDPFVVPARLPFAIGRLPECSRRCSQTKWRPGGRRARRGRQRNVTIFGSARAVLSTHTCALKCGTSPWIPAHVALRPTGNRASRQATERVLSPPDRLRHRESLLPCGLCEESTQFHSTMRCAREHRPGVRHRPERHEGRG